ncbi:MAG: DJ-1/PfpI family protein, partial [Methylocella sp.]
MHVVMLLYPRVTQLDLTGPFEVFARFEELNLHLVSKTLDPVTDSGGLRILPTGTLAGSPKADILFVPGGPGQISLMDDAGVLD